MPYDRRPTVQAFILIRFAQMEIPPSLYFNCFDYEETQG